MKKKLIILNLIFTSQCSGYSILEREQILKVVVSPEVFVESSRKLEYNKQEIERITNVNLEKESTISCKESFLSILSFTCLFSLMGNMIIALINYFYAPNENRDLAGMLIIMISCGFGIFFTSWWLWKDFKVYESITHKISLLIKILYTIWLTVLATLILLGAQFFWYNKSIFDSCEKNPGLTVSLKNPSLWFSGNKFEATVFTEIEIILLYIATAINLIEIMFVNPMDFIK